MHHAFYLLPLLPLIGWLIGYGLHYNRAHAQHRRAERRRALWLETQRHGKAGNAATGTMGATR